MRVREALLPISLSPHKLSKLRTVTKFYLFFNMYSQHLAQKLEYRICTQCVCVWNDKRNFKKLKIYLYLLLSTHVHARTHAQAHIHSHHNYDIIFNLSRNLHLVIPILIKITHLWRSNGKKPSSIYGIKTQECNTIKLQVGWKLHHWIKDLRARWKLVGHLAQPCVCWLLCLNTPRTRRLPLLRDAHPYWQEGLP